MKKQTNLLEGNISGQLLLFFFPVFFGTLFQQLYNTVDAIVVGNVLGKQALGAVGGSTGTMINLLVGFVTGLSSGATVVIAQQYGNRDAKGVSDSVASGMYLAIVMGVVLTFVGIVFAPQLMQLLNVPADIMDLAVTYMRYYSIGMLATLIYNTGAGILRAIGDSKRPLYFLIASCITNVVLDFLLVVIIPLGVAGAAIATVASQVVSCFMTLYVLYRTDECYHFSVRHLHYDKEILKQIVTIGFPTGIQSSLYAIANLFIQTSINGFGTDSVAAFTAYGKIDAFFWNASGALGTAVLTFCGQNFGAGNIQRVKKGMHISILMYLIGGTGLTLICYFGGEILFRMFTQDQEVITIGISIIKYLCPFWITFSLVEVFSSGIRACGDSLIPMLITALGIGAFRIIWIVFFPGNTIFDTLRSYPVSWVITSALFLLYYLFGGWLNRSLAQRNKILEKRK